MGVLDHTSAMSFSSQALRRTFLDFFARHGHEVVPSGPIVPPNDPTLLFANAGMVQFKDVFTGREQRSYRRAASSQKCIRISGKHNDLEAVGPSPRHLTFFEMLGNFSFGDYFKEQAIVFAWELITKELGLPPERLVFTYFKGEKDIPADDAAREIWQKLTGFGDDRIRGLGMDDNFWSMGETGPCGPCSEIYFYNGPEVDLGAFGSEQSAAGIGWMEIWNLVFMQFERSLVNGAPRLEPLPAPCIDTGAGLERLASVLQGKTSAYEVDVLAALVERAAEHAGKPYTGSREPDDVSMRVIADHSRTAAFMIAEGIMPDRTGREYVLRRVMRRAIRHGHRLGIQKPFLHDVAGKVVELMSEHYSELQQRRDLIASVCEQEELRFRQTIERGLNLLDDRFDALEQSGRRELSGADAFQLYDTYGFPLDLTEVICSERGFTLDQEGYKAALERARERSEFKPMDDAVEGVYREVLKRVPGSAVSFVGYEKDTEKSRVLALVKDGKSVESAAAGDRVELISERTSFYGEAGGQVGDTGRILTASAELIVENTTKPISGLIVHHARVASGELREGDQVTLEVDVARREAIRRNHSATHLLHWALRQVVGPHAQQKGSLVGPDRFRFDFTHGQPLTLEQIGRIEDLVNERVLQNSPIQTEVLDLEHAKSRGATMIFEEKYGSTVRMLSMAESVELCGGTHARATGDIGLFKIVGEQGIAAGVRRLSATTGQGSLDYLREMERTLVRAAQAAKSAPAQLGDRIEKLVQHERSLEKRVEELEKKLATGGAQSGTGDLLDRAREVGGIKVLGVRTEVSDRAALRELAEQLRDRLGDSVVLVGSASSGKAQLVLTVSKSVISRVRAGDAIRRIAQLVGGSGGGRPDMAEAGGSEPARLDEAIEAVYQTVQELLSPAPGPSPSA